VRRDEDIYAAVLQRVIAVDNGWGKPYDFQVLYVLDHAVLGVEDSLADLDQLLPTPPFDERLQVALRARLAHLPLLTFVPTIHELYETQPIGSIQMRDGGASLLAQSTRTSTPPWSASCSLVPMLAVAGFGG
jgi:hypothetical protein